MLLTFALLTALAAPADTISGTWQIKGEVAGNPLNSTCTLVVAESKVSGVCKNAEGKQDPITGEVKEGKVVFEHGGDYQGQELKIIYTATLPSAKEMKGTIEYQGQELKIIYTATLPSAKEMKGTIEVKPFDVSGEFTAVPAPKP